MDRFDLAVDLHLGDEPVRTADEGPCNYTVVSHNMRDLDIDLHGGIIR